MAEEHTFPHSSAESRHKAAVRPMALSMDRTGIISQIQEIKAMASAQGFRALSALSARLCLSVSHERCFT
jgi:hypothetical protein